MSDTTDLFCEYEQGYVATVKEHKHNLCELMRDSMSDNPNDDDLIERADGIEELARFLNVLNEEFEDESKEIRVFYSQDTNYFEYKIPTYEERYEEFTRAHAFSCREYFGLLRLAMGNTSLTSLEISRLAKEEDYKRVLETLEGVKEK